MSVNFTPEDPGELIGGSRFKKVDHYVLPKVCSCVKLLHFSLPHQRSGLAHNS